MRVCGKNVFNELDKTKIKKVYSNPNLFEMMLIGFIAKLALK